VKAAARVGARDERRLSLSASRSASEKFLGVERFSLPVFAARLTCAVQFKFFSVPINDPAAATMELNGFPWSDATARRHFLYDAEPSEGLV
jgi:hypothetical protein